MDFTGRLIKGVVFVDSAGLRGDALRQWVGAAAGPGRGLPPEHPASAARADDLAAAPRRQPGVGRHGTAARRPGLAVSGAVTWPGALDCLVQSAASMGACR